ncbi:MAG: T9SS type A sorting domain-containing protein, partial [Lentimicrobium sp.]|nr:T9SS type A sorting domain-containing protein [Lentimicrobium sp.]
FISNFLIEAHAPALMAGSITIDDAAGNGNGRLDAGETATLKITTYNPGDYTAAAAIAQLTTPSPFVTITNQSVELGDIFPGILNAAIAQFEIQVAPETPVGHAAAFNYAVVSGVLTSERTYNIPVGLILEDWETGGFESFEWGFSGTAPWAIATDQVFEGNNSSKSGVISDSQNSEMFVDYNVMNVDSISFYIKVSSENSYDYLKFYINGTMLDQWSGEVDWTRVVYPLSPGQQTFRWIYSKDGSVVSGSDAAWVDYIVFPSPLQTTAFAGPDAVTCEATAVMVDGMASNYVSSAWSTSGDGVFEDGSLLNTFYTPGVNDISNGTATLTLTVTGPDDQLMTDFMVLGISSAALVSAGDDIVVCSGAEVLLNATGTAYTSVEWTTSGTGTFTDNGSLTTAYIPSETDITAGSVTLSIVALSAAPCSDATDDLALQLLPLPTAALAGENSVCAGNTTTSISVDLTGTAPWNIEVNNGIGTLTATETPFVFEVSPAESAVYQIISVIDANNCPSAGTGEFNVTVNALPQLSLVSDTAACANHTVELTANSTNEVSFFWMPGEYTTQTIAVDTTGVGMGMHTWSVVVTDANGCTKSAQANVTFNDCTGIGEIDNSGIGIYPNPSSGLFNIVPSSKISGTFNLEIFGAGNKLVYSQNGLALNAGKNAAINAGQLADGIYMLKLTGKTDSYSAKLIIRK